MGYAWCARGGDGQRLCVDRIDHTLLALLWSINLSVRIHPLHVQGAVGAGGGGGLAVMDGPEVGGELLVSGRRRLHGMSWRIYCTHTGAGLLLITLGHSESNRFFVLVPASYPSSLRSNRLDSSRLHKTRCWRRGPPGCSAPAASRRPGRRRTTGATWRKWCCRCVRAGVRMDWLHPCVCACVY